MLGRGEATHLGRSRLSVDQYPDFLGNGVFLPFGGSLKSADGDSLDFVFDQEYYFFDPATRVVITTVTFTGGTGRFEAATGSADVMFVFDANFQHFVFLIDGSINY